MSENYNEDFEFIDPETGEPIEEDLGLLKFSELKGICERHIEDGNDPYTEDEFSAIVEWMEETRLNNSILQMVLDGVLDVVFPPDRAEEIEEGEIFFSLSKDTKKRLEETGEEDKVTGFLNLKFGDSEKEG